MTNTIPVLNKQEKNTLYIIGNGFDLYHGYKTSYHDFHDWLMAHNCDDFISNMEKMFPTLSGKEYLLWKDFEDALGRFDLLNIHHEFFQGRDDGFYDEIVQKRAVERIKPILQNIAVFLKDWLIDIDIEKNAKKLSLSSNSLYLTFNYTLLLERKYNIPDNHILHIHNSLTSNIPLITGHRHLVSEDDYLGNNVNEEKSTQLIANEMNGLYKPVEQLIKAHQHFFNSLKDISNVVVFGHSLAMIDRLYLNEVQRQIQNNSHWYFVAKDDNGIANYQNYVKTYNKLYDGSYGIIIGGHQFSKKMMETNCEYFKTEK